MNLQIQHIAKEFHNGTKALIDVDFRVSQGEFVSVIGPSGAGKTTLFRILNGMMECTGGQVLLDDKRFDSLKGRKKRELQIHRNHLSGLLSGGEFYLSEECADCRTSGYGIFPGRVWTLWKNT